MSHQNNNASVARNGVSIVLDADRNGDGVLDLNEAAEYLILDGKLNKQVNTILDHNRIGMVNHIFLQN